MADAKDSKGAAPAVPANINPLAALHAGKVVLYPIGKTSAGVTRYLGALHNVSSVTAADAKSAASGSASRVRTHLSLLIDRSSSMGRAFSEIVLPGMPHFQLHLHLLSSLFGFGSDRTVCCVFCITGCAELQKLSPTDEAVAVFFGRTVSLVPIKGNTDQFWVDQAKQQLEGATNMLTAIQQAVQNAIGHYQTLDAATAASTQYIFAMLSDGAENCNTGEALKSGIEACGEAVRALGLKSMFLVVGIGMKSDTSIGTLSNHANRLLWRRPLMCVCVCVCLWVVCVDSDACEDGDRNYGQHRSGRVLRQKRSRVRRPLTRRMLCCLSHSSVVCVRLLC
jgi:hypothetical protein